MWDKVKSLFTKDSTKPAAQVAEFTSKLSEKTLYNVGPVRNGRWVVFEDSVGVMVYMQPDFSNIAFADKDTGVNLGQRSCPTGQVRLANISEIPPSRRPTVADGKLLGYPE